jgi:uncharacterized protein with GYD domain
MATYIVLGNFTDQGLRSIKDSTKRTDALQAAAGRFGVKMSHVYWTMGQHDMVAVVEAPDEAAFTAFGLAIGAQGNIRTQTLRAFSREEMNAILGRLP